MPIQIKNKKCQSLTDILSITEQNQIHFSRKSHYHLIQTRNKKCRGHRQTQKTPHSFLPGPPQPLPKKIRSFRVSFLAQLPLSPSPKPTTSPNRKLERVLRNSESSGRSQLTHTNRVPPAVQIHHGGRPTQLLPVGRIRL